MKILKIWTFAIIALILSFIGLGGCQKSAREYGDTDEFRAFMQHENRPQSVAHIETSGEHTYALADGVLTFLGADGVQIWQSNPYWFVEDFRLFDVDGDGNTDCLFSLWKSYSFVEGYDENDDPAVRNHLFLYTIRGGHGKALWASSNLPRPIFSFEISEGTPTSISTGAVLKTVEGVYTDDFSADVKRDFLYTWQGWGFVPEDLPKQTAKLCFVGDLMVHDRQLLEAYDKEKNAYDFDYSFEFISEYISAADYAVGNLETVFAGGEKYSGYPFFNTPDQFANALKNAGFDLLTTANNHCLDAGENGVTRTLDVLDEIGIDHIGTYSSQEERDNNIFIKEIGGMRFAFLSYTYATNLTNQNPDQSYLVNIMSRELISADIQRAKSQNPDMIIILPHMGDEYDTNPTAEWQEMAHFMLECGADVVIGTHPHVVQPIEFVQISDENGNQREGIIAYSLGNFLSSQREIPTDAGVILELELERNRDGEVGVSSVSYTSTWVKFTDENRGFDIRILPVRDALEGKLDVSLTEGDISRMRDVLVEQSRAFLDLIFR